MFDRHLSPQKKHERTLNDQSTSQTWGKQRIQIATNMDCGITADKLANAWLDGPIWHTLQQVEKYTDQLRYIVSISKDEGQKTSHKT